MRRTATVLAFLSGFLPAVAAAQPPAVPALPDSERRTTYSISGTTCACAVNFAIYGTGTAVDSWIEVWLGGVRYLSTDPTFGWSLSSVTGTLATIPRPITDAVLTFNVVQTGTVQIVGARRPSRTSQFAENRGVAARDLNQIITDIVAMLREIWDRINDVTGRTIVGLPGETLTPLPAAASRANGIFAWDGSGNPIVIANPASGAGTVVGPMTSTNNGPVCWSSTVGLTVKDCGNTTFGGTLAVTGTATMNGALVVVGNMTATTGTFTGVLTQSSTANGVLPSGTTGQRPGSPTNGMYRYNSTLASLEFYNGNWNTIGVAPTVQTLTSGVAATYTPTAGTVRIRVRMVGGGGGGGAQSAAVAAVSGGTTSFGTTWQAVGGAGGAAAGGQGGAGGTGGSNGTGTQIVRFDGANGSDIPSSTASGSSGGNGGQSAFGGGGTSRFANAAGLPAKANTGSGGGGAGNTIAGVGSGGGAGGYVEFWVTNPAPTTYTIGAGGAGGTAGGQAGGAGAAGVIIIEEFAF